MSVECPDDNALVGFVHRTLPPATLSAVEVHLATCDGCRAVVATLANDLAPPPVSSEPTTIGEGGGPTQTFPAGATIGRYRVERPLGAGGMGVVYQAVDSELGRSVALKVLRSAVTDPSLGDGQARLRREAQTMAVLSHPNVVALYDVGSHDGHVFLAMELVRGRTLGEWLARGPSGSEILSVFRQAGLGLAAAHESGLVHRDFKPANVLVSDDGRVRVTDFGLARATSTPLPVASGQLSTVGIDTLTRTGMIVGTPAYMAPEQLTGGLADPRTDQFAFCVALYEALAGVRPFEGTSLAELHAAVMAELIRPPKDGRQLDSRVRAVLLRGLRPDPRERFPSMRGLLDALDAPAPRRWPIVAGGGALIATAAVVIAIGSRPAPVPAVEPPPPPTQAVSAEPPPQKESAAPQPVVAVPVAPAVDPEPPRPAKVAVAKPKKKSGEGVLSLHVAPWGEVSVDGRSVSSANMMDYVVSLSAGRHQVRVRHPQLGERTETVTIDGSKTTERRISLR